MSLCPFFFSDLYRPSRLTDQQFGSPITPDDVIMPAFNFPSGNYFRPWRTSLQTMKNDNGSTLTNDKDKLQINIDVQQFMPNEISVKTADREIIIEAKHEERLDEHGFVSRQFLRRYILPENCDPKDVASSLTADGVLIVTASKKTAKSESEMKSIPILKSEMKYNKAQETNNNICKDNIKCNDAKKVCTTSMKEESKIKSDFLKEQSGEQIDSYSCESAKKGEKSILMEMKDDKGSMTASDLAMKMTTACSLDSAIASSIESKKKDYSTLSCEIMESKESFTSCDIKKTTESTAEFISDRISAELKMAAENFQ